MPQGVGKGVGHVGLAHRHRFELRPETISGGGGQVSLVVDLVAEGDRERPDRPAEMRLRQPEHRAGIDAATQVGSDLDIGHQTLGHRIIQHRPEPRNHIGVASTIGRQRSLRRIVDVPVAPDVDVSVARHEHAPGRHRVDVGEQRAVGRADAVTLGEERVTIPACRDAQREQRLDLRGHQDVAAPHRVEERLHAEAIAHRNQAAATLIGDHDRELASQTVHELGAPPLVETKGDLAVGVRRETDTLGLEAGADRPVAVQLAVHHAADVPVVVGKRLIAVVESDDAQPDVAEQASTIRREPPAGVVRTPVGDRRERPRRSRIGQGRLGQQRTDQAAHCISMRCAGGGVIHIRDGETGRSDRHPPAALPCDQSGRLRWCWLSVRSSQPTDGQVARCTLISRCAVGAESGRDIGVTDTHRIHEHAQGGVEKTPCTRVAPRQCGAAWPMEVDRGGRAIALGSQLLRVERKPAPALLAA